MQWIMLAIVVLIFFGVPYGLFVVPLSRVLLRALRIARDPMHRSTPEDAWELLDRIVWNRLIRFWLMWAILLFASCMVGPMMFIILAPFADAYPLLFFYALIYPAHLAGSWALAFSGILFWVPRSGPRGLLARVSLTVVSAQAIVLAASWLMLGRAGGINTMGKEVWTSFAILTLFVGVVSALASWHRARRLGEEWFRLDKEEENRSRRRKYPS